MGAADAVEIGADADMVDARDPADVIDVIGDVRNRRGRLRVRRIPRRLRRDPPLRLARIEGLEAGFFRGALGGAPRERAPR